MSDARLSRLRGFQFSTEFKRKRDNKDGRGSGLCLLLLCLSGEDSFSGCVSWRYVSFPGASLKKGTKGGANGQPIKIVKLLELLLGVHFLFPLVLFRISRTS